MCHERIVHSWMLKRVNCTHLDLFRLASAAAAWSSWVDLLTGTPNTALWVTSLRIRLWPLLGATFGDEGGVKEQALWMSLPAACNKTRIGKMQDRQKKKSYELGYFYYWSRGNKSDPSISPSKWIDEKISVYRENKLWKLEKNKQKDNGWSKPSGSKGKNNLKNLCKKKEEQRYSF